MNSWLEITFLIKSSLDFLLGLVMQDLFLIKELLLLKEMREKYEVMIIEIEMRRENDYGKMS